MRLLHVVPTYLPATRYGGTIYAVHGLCKALAQKGHEVHVFTTNVDGPGDSDVPLAEPVDVDGVQVWYFSSPWLRRLFYAPSMSRALEEKVGTFNIVHLHSIFLWPTWAAARAARRLGVPYLVAPHGMLVRDLVRRKSRWVKKAWIRLVEKGNIERASALHVTSDLERCEAEAFNLRLPPVYCVPNGIDVPMPGSDVGLSDRLQGILPGRGFVLYLGRINWKKGLDRLIPAMAHVKDGVAVVAGNDEEGYLALLKALAARCGVREHVRFIGYVDGPEKAEMLRRASLLVLPSYSENFGIVVLEAMAHGCPVLVTPEVGAADIVQAAKGGAVISGEPALLGRKIAELLDDPAQLRAMGMSGMAYVGEHCTWGAVASEMGIDYEMILKRRETPVGE